MHFVQTSLFFFEFQQLQKEFDDFEYCIRDLREFVVKNTSDWGTPNRLQLQLDHITVNSATHFTF